MHIFAFLAFFLFTQCALALGPEEQEFVGKVGKNTITLTFLNDPNFYAAASSPIPRCANEWIDDQDRLICDSKDKGDSSVIYVMEGKKPSRLFREARQLYKSLYPRGKVGIWNEKGVYSDNFYVCTQGCSKSVPEFFILITHGD